MSGSAGGSGNPGDNPDWLLNATSPMKHTVHEHQIFSPTGGAVGEAEQPQRRPASGRRARTPMGYSSVPPADAAAPQATYSRGAAVPAAGGGARPTDSLRSRVSQTSNATATRRPSYEDPLDVLQRQGLNDTKGSHSAPPSRPVSPHTSPPQRPGSVESKRGSTLVGGAASGLSLAGNRSSSGLSATGGAAPPTPPQGPVEFTMPINPCGQHMVINCLTTWGDPHYIGMNGVEFFGEDGNQLKVVERQVTGDPESINVLPDYTNDPRVVRNLVNGVCRTCDDRNLWLAPYTRGGDHLVKVNFERPVVLSMIRFWNYNKQRTHSSRGVKDVEITLDGTCIFAGEVRQAPGILKGSEEETEILLFTVDANVLQKIDTDITSQHEQWRVEDDWTSSDFTASNAEPVNRPPTSHGKPASGRSGGSLVDSFTDRPTTTVRGAGGDCTRGSRSDPSQAASPQIQAPPPRGEVVTVTIVAGWGDMQSVGMQGLTLLSDRRNPNSAIPVEHVECSVAGGADPNALVRSGGAHWRVGYDMDQVGDHPVTLTFRLGTRSMISGMRVFNYNERLAATSRGVKRLVVHVDGQLCSPPGGFYIRKAPGHEGFDHSQVLGFSTSQADFQSTVHSSLNNKSIADALHVAKLIQKPFPKVIIDKLGFEPPLFPVGYVVRIELNSTHGDRYYVGLNGIQLFNVRNEEIPLNPHNLQAVPKDITVLPQSAQDCRVLGNLVSPKHNTSADASIWLAPFSPGTVNLLYIVFEEPVAISRIAFWNYSKTPTRGVDGCTVYVDDTLVYSGRLRPAPAGGGGDFAQHMIFTNDPIITKLDLIQSAPSEKSTSGVVFFDSGKVSDLDAMPQTSCGRPSSRSDLSRRPLRGCAAAGFNSAGGSYY